MKLPLKIKILIIPLLIFAGFGFLKTSFWDERAGPVQVGQELMVLPAQVAIKTDKFFLVDRQGVVIKIAETSGNLPVILAEKTISLKPGERFEQREIISTIELLIELKDRQLSPTMAKVSSSNQANIWLRDDVLAIISLQKELELQLDSLQLILSRVKIEGKRLKQIDLRFDKPIINYE